MSECNKCGSDDEYESLKSIEIIFGLINKIGISQFLVYIGLYC